MKTFKQLHEEINTKEKQFLVKLSMKLSDDVVNAWIKSAKKEVTLSKVEKYADDILKVTVTKGTSAALKRTWSVLNVQNLTSLLSQKDSPVEMTYYNIRNG